MKAAYLTGYGGSEVIRYGELPDPVLQPGHVVVEVRAAGVNPVEIAMRSGEFRKYQKYRFPHVMGLDIAGVVAEVGDGVTGFKAGDEVYAVLPGRKQGGYAQRVLVPAANLALKPSTLSHVEAASLPTVALTVWQAFHERAKLQRGEKILIQPGAGGIGTFAIQLARHMGAEVYASASARNQDFLKALGAQHPIDYAASVAGDSGPFDVVLDGLGGAAIAPSIRALKPKGRYVGLVRAADARAFRELGVPALFAWLAARRIRGYRQLARARDVEYHGVLTRPDGKQLTAIAGLIDKGIIKPFVARTYPLRDLGQAFAELEAGHVRGKIVIDISGV
ncbi:NADP-dependent oxidoreductase [Cupriavidus sp. 30B13]|uniref:NADP-dependent oxidoreductase n=1 Tax=Cupriavidus sp. 30B13 TaxID=3384241 RepID=UPI003B91AC54